MPATKPIYLDHAATTPLDSRVLAAMQPYLTTQFYNPSATYLAGRAVRRAVESARAGVAHWLGARPSEITFTAGGTEANNLAVHGIMAHYPGANLVTTTIEHDAVLAPAAVWPHKLAEVGPDGVVTVEAVERLIDDQTVLVSVMYANNEIGTIQPLHRIARMLEAKRKERRASGNELPLLLHSDACQAALYLDLHAVRLGVDLLTINASKMYGPKQIGALYVKAGIVLEPVLYGGGQERGLRSGTENVAGIIGLAAALELAQTDRRQESDRLSNLQRLFVAELEQAVPRVVINGSRKHRLPNNIHLTIPAADNERLMMALDEAGIMVAVGSACSASSGEPSHVLRAIGMTDEDARASLRLTMGHSTDEAAVRRTVAALAALVA
ncbi:MAG TPA: cysteine desulfurase family protein [Candidatus Saccharimonadales bacterium]|nr:cysteine desulfurase family protein [Candidatus Saccharimonadales bacterium]